MTNLRKEGTCMDEGGMKGASSSRAAHAGKKLVSAAENYLALHSAEKFSLQEIANALYINGSYLLRVYKAYTGHTLLWYHSHLRCEKAKELLTESDLSISEIGEKVGFVSSAHFSHVFKKLTGTTPSAYRLSANSD